MMQRYRLILKIDVLNRQEKQKLIRLFSDIKEYVSDYKRHYEFHHRARLQMPTFIENTEIDIIDKEKNIITAIIDYDDVHILGVIRYQLSHTDIGIIDLEVTLIDYKTFEIQSDVYNRGIAFLDAEIESKINVKTKYPPKVTWSSAFFKTEKEFLEYLNSDDYDSENWLQFNTFEDAEKHFSDTKYKKIIRVKDLEKKYLWEPQENV